MKKLLFVMLKAIFVCLPIAVFILLFTTSAHATLISSTTDPFEGAIVGPIQAWTFPKTPVLQTCFWGQTRKLTHLP